MATEDTGVHNLTTMDQFKEAKSQGSLMVIDCYATWCGPCKAIAPKVIEFAKQFPNVGFYKLDVDEVPDVAQELEVRAMPTFFLFKDGKQVTKVVGANPQALGAAIAKGVNPQEEH